MTFAEDFWLRGKAAQSSMLQLMAYNTAFAGTATLQAWKLGLTAPAGFWQAMGRVSGANGGLPDAAAAVVIDLPVKTKTAARKKAKVAKATPNPVDAITLKIASKPAKPASPKTTPAKPNPVKSVSAPNATTAQKATPKPNAKAEAAKAKAASRKQIDLGPSPHLLDAPRGGKADDLTTLTGVGTKLASALNEFGIYHFDQIATLDERGVDWLNEQQPGFKMLATRYKLIDQAKARIPT